MCRADGALDGRRGCDATGCVRYGKAGLADTRTKNEWTRYNNDYQMSITARNYVKFVVFVEARCQAKGVELSDVPRGHPSELDVRSIP